MFFLTVSLNPRGRNYFPLSGGHLLYKNMKLKTNKAMTLPSVLYG